MARTGRPKLERQTPKSTFIRLSTEELAIVEGFLDQQAQGVIGGEKITVAAYGRALMLREALTPLIRAWLLNVKPEQVFDVELVMHGYDLTPAMKKSVLAALRDMATRKEVVAAKDSPTAFFKPKH